MKRLSSAAYWIIVGVGLIVHPGLAQQQPASPDVQACLAKLTTEMNSSLQVTSSLIAANQAMERAQARIKELEDKYEPKKAEPPPAKK